MGKEQNACLLKSLANKKAVKRPLFVALISFFILLLAFYITFSMTGKDIFSHSSWDSYTRQAEAWLSGTAYLDVPPQSVAHLELAEFENRLFVSFPPVPSVLQVPMVLLFGRSTPDILLTYIYFAVGGVFISLLFHRKNGFFTSILFGVLASAAGNMLSMAAFGGVWHEAQGLAFAFSAMSVYYITSQKSRHWRLSLFLGALAVGCRPLLAFFMPVLLVYLYNNVKNTEGLPKTFLQHAKKWAGYLYLPALVALLLCWYNYIRFGSPFEFGHNHLPEFTRSEYGQFHFSYLERNLSEIMLLPGINGTWQGTLLPVFQLAPEPFSFNLFTASVFYFVNPIILFFLLYLVKNTVENTGENKLLFFGAFIAFIVATCLHKTLGGHQFGARYFFDMVPFLALYIAESKPKAQPGAVVVALLCIALNIWGTGVLFNK